MSALRLGLAVVLSASGWGLATQRAMHAHPAHSPAIIPANSHSERSQPAPDLSTLTPPTTPAIVREEPTPQQLPVAPAPVEAAPVALAPALRDDPAGIELPITPEGQIEASALQRARWVAELIARPHSVHRRRVRIEVIAGSDSSVSAQQISQNVSQLLRSHGVWNAQLVHSATTLAPAQTSRVVLTPLAPGVSR
ncbi:MAG: hypothetical protein Q8Q09_27470 [Deltaproteobacteria bacterium]|nr:hypothetical protein [Deltaproteobacteria bacterium]